MAERICLVVDDEPAIRSYMRAILQREHFQTLEADSVPKALKIIQKLDGCLDLVVTDINMPGDMDGLDLAHSLRHMFPKLPVLLMTGHEINEVNASEFDLLRKPFGAETILDAVTRLIAPTLPEP